MHSRYFLVKVGNEYTELSPVNAGVPQGSVLGPLLYFIHTAELPPSPESTTVTFADDTTVIATDNPAIAHTYYLGLKNGERKPRVLNQLVPLSPLEEICVRWFA
jgi:hypothetical protein